MYMREPTKNPARVSLSSAVRLHVRGDSEIQKLHLVSHGVVHDVLRLKVAMNYPGRVSCMNGCSNLRYDDCSFFAGQRGVLLCVSLEKLTRSPLDSQKMKSGVGFSNLDGSHDVRMLHTRTVLRFSNEACNGSAIMSQLFTEYLEGDSAMAWMLSLVHCGRTALSDLTLK